MEKISVMERSLDSSKGHCQTRGKETFHSPIAEVRGQIEEVKTKLPEEINAVRRRALRRGGVLLQSDL
jgi:hypothetical protein